MTEPEKPVVRMPGGGRLLGRRQAGVAAFLGVPYARPPVGEARFRPPEPAPPWTGDRDATAPGPIAPQPVSRLERVTGPQQPMAQAEDCLTVNVWTPDPVSGPRPVLVFVHGGGFLTGSGGLEWYHGAELARRGGLTVVTINYRLGVLGFGYFAGLTDDLGEGNLGLLDVREALRWVRANIAAFGGDQADITVAGQSGGALSILALLSGSSGRGLFRRAVLQSIPGGMRPWRPERATEIATHFLRVLGVPPGRAGLLRTLPTADLLAAQEKVAREVRGGPRDFAPPFQLVADGELVAEDPVGAVGARAADGVRILLGFTRDEAAAFLPGAEGVAELTDDMVRRPTLRLAEALAEHGNPAWLYQFDWSPAGSPFGACHCIELPFVFGNPHAWRNAPMLGDPVPGPPAAVTDLVQRAWIAFVRDGDPGHGGLPGWPRYSRDRRGVLRFSPSPALGSVSEE
ncbi:carboxylesterase/lipase family protein [Amycolatopsis anabasis]|uniref:carboxylesterase/lipase family protein n=1 Tax=Amycolatopsis anabasis TaxID=1840409 RepID=UPI00131D6563|nr:carboxylesterase family protein [Amycolatopsis anabasis]